MERITLTDLDNWEDNRKRGRFINCLSGIKTGVLVGTVNIEKKTNLAIFTSIFHLGADPSLMGMIVRPDASPRHTLQNILDIKSFTLNILPYEMHREGHQTSARYTEDQSEFKECGFTEEWLNDSKVPFVKESQVKWLMELVRVIDIPENNTHMIIGRVLEVYFPKDILSEDGSLDIAVTDPTLVTGLDSYHQVKKGTRYSYAKPDKKPSII